MKKGKLNGRKHFIVLIAIFLGVLLVSGVFSASAISYDLEYDANGNLIEDEDKYYEYDGLNQLVKIRSNDSNGEIIAEFVYDHEGDRVKKVAYKPDGSYTTTYYINRNFVREINSEGEVRDTVYYYDEQGLTAEEDHNNKLSFYHLDHLGSPDIITNENGKVVEDLEYLPFGATVEGNQSRFQFTGQEKDKETGLMYFKSRYYDTKLRRFTQPDTILPNIYDPQQLNRYAYARNNPGKYTDPEGEFIIAAALIGAGIGSLFGAGISLGTQLYRSRGDFSRVSWSSVGRSAGIGAGAGLIGGLTGGIGWAAGGSSTSAIGYSAIGAGYGANYGIASRTISSAANGRNLNQREILNPKYIARDAVIGGTLTGAGFIAGKGISKISRGFSGRSSSAGTGSATTSATGYPTKWIPPQRYGLGGPGEARQISPRTIERVRLDFGDSSRPFPHWNHEIYKIDNYGKVSPNPQGRITPILRGGLDHTPLHPQIPKKWWEGT